MKYKPSFKAPPLLPITFADQAIASQQWDACRCGNFSESSRGIPTKLVVPMLLQGALAKMCGLLCSFLHIVLSNTV